MRNRKLLFFCAAALLALGAQNANAQVTLNLDSLLSAASPGTPAASGAYLTATFSQLSGSTTTVVMTLNALGSWGTNVLTAFYFNYVGGDTLTFTSQNANNPTAAKPGTAQANAISVDFSGSDTSTSSGSGGNFDVKFAYHTNSNLWHSFANAESSIYHVTRAAGGILAPGSFAQTSTAGYFAAAAFNNASLIAAPIPEPETWAMMLAGLGFMGWYARRRKELSQPTPA